MVYLLNNLEWPTNLRSKDGPYQASTIVNAQEVARGEFPAGGYVSSSLITPDFFSDAAEKRRTELVQTGMPFLHSLIHRKIAHSQKKKSTERNDEDQMDLSHTYTSPSHSQEEVPRESRSEGPVDDVTVMSMENLVYVKTTPSSQADHRLAKVRAHCLYD